MTDDALLKRARHLSRNTEVHAILAKLAGPGTPFRCWVMRCPESAVILVEVANGSPPLLCEGHEQLVAMTSEQAGRSCWFVDCYSHGEVQGRPTRELPQAKLVRRLNALLRDEG